jgi:hypothetical protein
MEVWRMIKILFRFTVLMLPLALLGCGGAKVLKEPEPLMVSQSLASASDQRLSATLDWIIVRDGPGTWAKNVDWDEYLIRVQNLSGDSIQLTNITVFDSLGTQIECGNNRKQLVKGTKNAKRRFKGEGLQVKAGAGAGTLLVGGVAVGGAAAAVAMSTIGLYTSASGGAVVAATGGLILAPVLAVGGVMRGVNNSRVDKQIKSRQTVLPIMLQEKEEKSLNIFFPLTPSPRQIEFNYVDSRGEHTLVIDTQATLEGLHLVSAD